MIGAEVVEVACLIVAFACVCFLAEARLEVGDVKVSKALAEARADSYLLRAFEAEARVSSTAELAADFVVKLENLRLLHADCPNSPARDLAADQALEVAEPTPDLKRVQ